MHSGPCEIVGDDSGGRSRCPSHCVSRGARGAAPPPPPQSRSPRIACVMLPVVALLSEGGAPCAVPALCKK